MGVGGRETDWIGVACHDLQIHSAGRFHDDTMATFEKSYSGLWLDVRSFETFILPQVVEL